MIATLRAGQSIRLPSGNRVRLLRREGAAWVCEYLPGAKQRGEVEFTSGYLRKFGFVTP